MEGSMDEMGADLRRLPSGVLSVLVNQLKGCDQGSLRCAASRDVSEEVDQAIETVDVGVADLAALANLLRKLKGLKELGLSADTEFSSYKCYAQLRSHVPNLVSSLQSLTALTSLRFSSAAAQQLGALRWARMEAQNAVAVPGCSSSSSSNDGVAQSQPSPLHQVLWIPDWLASAPNLRKLVIHTPDCPSSSTTTTTSSSSSSSRLSSQPVWLWLQPKAWASKLTCLELRGVPLSDTTAISLQQLTGLHRLAIQGCRLPPSAVERLLQQLAHCKHLTALLLCGNDMWLMPKLGWEAVAGLQELDVSRNMLLELPVGLSSLVQLTALHAHHNSLTTLHTELSALSRLVTFDVSHNWLSGARASLPVLLPSWPRLAVLALDNVSDKRGALALTPELAGCWALRELSIQDNFAVEWSSVLAVLPSCKGLRVLRLSGSTAELPEKELRAVQPGCLDVLLT